MKKTRTRLQLLVGCSFTFVVSVAVGCSNQVLQIEGTVRTTRDLASSFLASGLHMGSGDIPVTGARVYLAYDSDAAVPIPGFETESDRDGNYSINLANLPPPDDRDGYYYFVARKVGYAPVIRAIGIGPYSTFLKNTAFLKPIRE
jgi:hypothetical protein